MQTINVRFLQKTVIKVSGATILALASLLFVVLLPQSAEALVWQQNTLSGPIGFTNFNDISNNYGYSYGVLIESGLYSGVRTIYFNVCADTESYTGMKGVVWNLNQSPSSGPVASTTVGYMADCGDYASTTSDYTQWSYVVFDESVSVGTYYDDAYVFALHFSGTNDGFYYEPADMDDGFVTYGCVKPPKSSYYCRTYDNYYTVGFAIDTTAVSVEPPVYSLPAEGGLSTYANTKFTNVSISSTTGYVNFEVDYYLDPAEYNPSVSSFNPTTFAVSLALSPEVTYTTYGWEISGTGNQTYDGDWPEVLVDGTYDYQVKFSNFGCSSGLSACPFPQSYVYGQFTISGGVIISSTTPDFYNAERFSSWESDEEPPYSECSITDITGCIVNAFRFLFYPSADSIEAVTTQYQSLNTKIPFVYVSQASDLFTGLYTGTASTIPEITVETGIGNITLISEAQVAAIPYVSLLRSLIAAGLWIMLFTIIYRKTLKIHDNVTV